MNNAKESLITRMVDTRIQNIRNNSDEGNWIAEALNFGWVGYDKYSDEELLEEAEMLELDNLPSLAALSS